MKKYKLTRIKIKAKLNDKEVTLYRIRALTNIYNSVGTLIVGKGHLGGFVEGEENLSQFGCAGLLIILWFLAGQRCKIMHL